MGNTSASRAAATAGADALYTRTQAKGLAARGEWDEALWEALPKDRRGRVTHADLLSAQEARSAEGPRVKTKPVLHPAPTSTKPSVLEARLAAASSGSASGAGSDASSDTASASSAAGGASNRSDPGWKRPFVGSEPGSWDEPGVSSKASVAERVARYRRAGLENVPVTLKNGRTFVYHDGTKELVEQVGGPDVIRSMCTRFYAKAFQDFTLAPFMFEGDGALAHGKRLGDWIVEKMGVGSEWSDTRIRHGHSRQGSHSKAWHSEKREPAKKGRRFKLDDCRVWMRLMFWAMREEGLHEHKAFRDWYVGFIGHFIRVYEFTAPPFTEESAAWSGHDDKVAEYIANDRTMTDVIGNTGDEMWDY